MGMDMDMDTDTETDTDMDIDVDTDMDTDTDIKKYGMMGVNKEGDEAEESQIARLLIFT